MITGAVNSHREAAVFIDLLAADGRAERTAAIIDTGFSGSLTLPFSLISSLGLPFRSRGSAILADGTETQFDIHAATIIWDGQLRHILVEVAETDPLIGMNLLYGHSINIRAVDGGAITIEKLT